MSVERRDAGSGIDALLARRWSPRAFDAARRVARDDVERLLEAARWAPSCYNEQPWRIIVADSSNDEVAWRAIFRSLVEANQRWARNAPVLLVIAGTKLFANGTPNRWSAYDAGSAGLSIALQAAMLDLAVHQMGGFDAEQLAHDIALPADWEPMSIAAVGYPADPGALDERTREREARPRTRRAIDSFAFEGSATRPFFAERRVSEW